MNPTHDSLSVVLPVRNNPRGLARKVADLLEVLPELTSRFEVLILDRGSTDQTEETAHELARGYPQLKVLRVADNTSDAEMLQTALDRTRGDLVVVLEEASDIRTAQLSQMWQLRTDRRLIVARSDDSGGSLVERLKAWARGLPDDVEPGQEGGFQILRRPALAELPSPRPVPAPATASFTAPRSASTEV